MTSNHRINLRTLLQADWQHLQLLGGTQRSLKPWHYMHPRFCHILLIRLVLTSRKSGWKLLSKMISIVLYFGYRIELNTHVDIGPGLVLPHPMGIVIGASRIGARAVIFQNVTLGAKSLDVGYDPTRRPQLGDDVTVGSGAVVVGGVRIGNASTVAANSLVTRDVAESMLSIGVPAQSKPL
ncbi:MAG: DapH/DapD/GlmU-related protein [Paracoccaceae bacterium]